VSSELLRIASSGKTVKRSISLLTFSQPVLVIAPQVVLMTQGRLLAVIDITLHR
jgi:hypothetical protein